MKDYETFPPLEIVSAQGAYLTLKNGKSIIDAVSSWWCKSLGHNHPSLKQALIKQVEKFEHVILANTTNEVVEQLSERLTQFMPGLSKQPDFVCLSKGLTSGWLPLSVVLTNQDIYEVFYGDRLSQAFLHSHTYSGNALAASVAVVALKIIEEQDLCERANKVGEMMLKHMHKVAKATGALTNIRGIGAIVAQ